LLEKEPKRELLDASELTRTVKIDKVKNIKAVLVELKLLTAGKASCWLPKKLVEKEIEQTK